VAGQDAGLPLAVLPDVPGNGLEWDEGAVAHYQAGR